MCLYNKWIKNPIGLSVTNHSDNYPTPINLSYFWGFGSLAGFALAIQLFTGIFLAMHYTPEISLAFISVEHIMRDVVGGVGLRYMHANGASMFFIIVYCHMFRGLYYGSYLQPRAELWYSGVLIFFLMMATGFMGYVLPWGQMSFWGATVITNLFSAVPFIGKYIVQILWGGFSVENPTLNRFFSLHYLLPFIILALVLTHLILLHKDGSSNPLGIESNLDRVFFLPYFYFKDFLGACFFAAFFSFFVIYAPNFLGHPDNYIEANPMVTPAHIVPEWYFLPFYAILRTIPDKLGGVILMVFAILILFFLPNLDIASIRSNFFKPFHIVLFWFLVSDGIILGWVGQEVVETPFIEFSNIITPLYFIYFIIALPFVSNLEKVFLKALLITPSTIRITPLLKTNFGVFFIILMPNTMGLGLMESWYTYSNMTSLGIILLTILVIAMALKPVANTIQVVTMLSAVFLSIFVLHQLMNTSYLQLQEEIPANFFMTLTGNFFMVIATLFISVLLFGFASKIILEANSKIEFTLLILTIFLSGVFVNNVNSFLNIIILLECFAFASYILVGFERTSKFSAIAGVKYLLVSAAPTGIFILGISLIYFLFGTLDQTALMLFLAPVGTLITSEGLLAENLIFAASVDANKILELVKNTDNLIASTPGDVVHLLEFFNKTWLSFMRRPELIIQTYPEIGLQVVPYFDMALNDIYKKELIQVFETRTPVLVNTIIKSNGAFDFEKIIGMQKIWSHTYMTIQDSIYILNLHFSQNSSIQWSGDLHTQIHPDLKTYWITHKCTHSLNWGEYVYGRQISLKDSSYTPIPKGLRSNLFLNANLFWNDDPHLIINALLTDPKNPFAFEIALRQLEAYQKVVVSLESLKAGHSPAEEKLHLQFIEHLLTRKNTDGLENTLAQDGPTQLGAVCLATSLKSINTIDCGEINWDFFPEHLLVNSITIIGQIYFIPLTAYLLICYSLFSTRQLFVDRFELKTFNPQNKNWYDAWWLYLWAWITGVQWQMFFMFFKSLSWFGNMCLLYFGYTVFFPIYNDCLSVNIAVTNEWDLYLNIQNSTALNYLHFVAIEMSQQNVNFAVSSNEAIFTAKHLQLPNNKAFIQYLMSLENLVAKTGVTTRHTVDVMKVEWVHFMTLPSQIEKSFPYISQDLNCEYYTRVSQYCIHRMALICSMLEPFDNMQTKFFANSLLTDHQIWVYKFRSLTKSILGIQYEVHFLNQWAWGFNLHPKTGEYYSLQDNPVDPAVLKELHPNLEKLLRKYNCVAIREFFYVVQANDKSINQMPTFTIPHFFNGQNIHVIGTPKFVDAIIFPPQVGGKKDLIFASKQHLYVIAEASNQVLNAQLPVIKMKVGNYTVGELHEKNMSDFADFLWAQPKNQGLQIPNGGKIISYNDAIIPNTEKAWTPPSPPFAASSFALGLEPVMPEIPNFLTNIFIPNMTNFFVLDTILITFAIFLIFINLFFKITAAPFHLWAPSVYGGAPLATLTFLSIFSKLTLFFLIIRLIFNTFDTLFINWQNLFLLVSLLSICSAILGAFGENSFKRFFIYSSTGHVGFMLLGISLLNITGLIATIDYLLLYVISSLIIWFIIIHLTKKTITLINLKGLSLNQPYLGLIFSTVMFSLSGLPPFGGFFVKYEIFLGLIEASFFYLGYILLLLTVISFFYYLRLIKIVFFEEQKIFSKNLNLSDIKLRIIPIIFFLIPFFLLFIENPITHFFKEIFIKSLY